MPNKEKSVIKSDETARTKVVEHFGLDSSASDDFLLRKIHLGRAKKSMPFFCVSYLFEAFLSTNDVRFFNEFLWLSKEDDLHAEAIKHFKNQLGQNGFYTYCYDEDFRSCLTLKGDDKAITHKDFEKVNVCLIGSPFHFISAYGKLKKLGADIDVINVRYNQSKIQHLILNNAFTSLLYRLVFGKKNYFEIDIADKKELKHITLPKKYDIGFHKLGFIISKSLIDQFRKGLINDHWGALPLFKGRSTLEYSRLFGANLVVTNHLVSPAIDSGVILSFTPLNRKRIKRDIYLGLGDRIVHSLGLLASDRKMNLDNTKGKMFYEIHPWLLEYAKNINAGPKHNNRLNER